MASNKGQSSRQKMINLMYLVFIAMLALNVSSEVLDGFDLVNDNLLQTINNTTVRNNQIYSELVDSYQKNPAKTKEWYDRATEVKDNTDSIFKYIEYLKLEIAKFSDGDGANPNDLQKKDDLDASSEIMLSPVGGHGNNLKKNLDDYRERVLTLISDTAKSRVIRNGLSTELSARSLKNEKTDWVTASFENMPSIAVLTYLSELQLNIKQAEGEALSSLLKNVDFSDLRVNDVQAFVISESNMVMRGESYKAKIVLAAVDTTMMPTIVVGGKTLPSSVYQVAATTLGTHTLKGSISLMSRDGTPTVREFEQQYTVMEPMATIAPLLMDVVYAGINNPISISVPGVGEKNVLASAVGGTLTRDGKNWIARPTKVGQKFTITVSSNASGSSRVVAQKEFRIRALPDPTAYIEIKDDNGNPKMFKRGRLSRSVILGSSGIKAAIDDGILNIPFTVISFRTLFVDAMNNAMPEMSNGAHFSQRQLDQIKRIERGRYFFISSIRVKGPDGLEREIAAMDIIVN